MCASQLVRPNRVGYFPTDSLVCLNGYRFDLPTPIVYLVSFLGASQVAASDFVRHMLFRGASLTAGRKHGLSTAIYARPPMARSTRGLGAVCMRFGLAS